MIYIRPSTASDAPTMTELFLKARSDAMPYLPVLYTQEQTHWWMLNKIIAPGETRVAVGDEKVFGFITRNGEWIEHLYVAPDAQGQGIGQRLLQSVLDEKPTTLALHVFQKNERARSFYERMGFVLVELNDSADNEERTPAAVYKWYETGS